MNTVAAGLRRQGLNMARSSTPVTKFLTRNFAGHAISQSVRPAYKRANVLQNTSIHSRYLSTANMSLTSAKVAEIFKLLEDGKGPEFFSYFTDDVEFTVTNPDPESKSHALSGVYPHKGAFLQGIVGAVGEALTSHMVLKPIDEPIVSGNSAVIELRALNDAQTAAPVGKNGVKFDNRYAWILKFNEDQKITHVRIYYDSALVKDLLA